MGELVRLMWADGDFDGTSGWRQRVVPQIGLVVDLVVETPVAMAPEIKAKRLVVWWSESSSFSKHPVWELWPLGSEETP